MNVNNKFIKVFLILFFLWFFNNITIYAGSIDRVFSGGNQVKSYAGTCYVPKKTINNQPAYCTEFNLNAPKKYSNEESFANYINGKYSNVSGEALAAASAVIINSDIEYICKEFLLTAFIDDKRGITGRDFTGTCWSQITSNNYSNCGGQAYSNVKDNAYNTYNAYLTMMSETVTFNSETLAFEWDGSNFVASTTISYNSNYTPWCEVSGGNSSYIINGNTVTVTVPNSGTRSNVTLTCGIDHVYTDLFYYETNEQDLIRLGENKTKRNSNTIAGTVPENKIITIKKVNSSNEPVIYKEITFNVYSAEGCNQNALYGQYECSTGGDGICEINVPLGEYWVKEAFINDDNYIVSDVCVSDSEVNDYNQVVYVNDLTCKGDLKSNSSIANRIYLYQTKYGNFKNLLNFKKDKFDDACSEYTPNYSSEESCLYANKISDSVEENFTYENISDYNDTLRGDDDTISYCLTDFRLERKIEMPTDTIPAGRLIISSDTEDAVVATGTLTKKCYIHKDDLSDYIVIDNKIITQSIYSDYISSISLDNKELRSSSTNDFISLKDNGLKGEFYEFSGSVSVNYYLNPVYVYKLTGKICDNISDIGCVFIGYGILSKFNSVKTSNQSFGFSINNTLAENKLFNFSNSNDCTYNAEEEIIKYPNDNGKLDLEFRTIDTTNPFNRTPNINWEGNLSDGKAKVDKYIKNSNNSYNKTGEGAIYTNQTTGTKRIILTPDVIQEIKIWNETHPYDDYTLECDEKTGVCENAFLKNFEIVK